MTNSACMSRPRVDRVLREAVESARLTVLHAPLGSGKSCTAVTAFAGHNSVAFMRAQPWHRVSFVGALVEAVRLVRPEFGSLTLGAAEASASSSHIGRTFAQELGHIDEPILVVVDNVHEFAGESSFARFVEAAVRAAPSSARLLALGRSLPNIALSESAFRGDVRILTGEFLAFDTDEVRALAEWMKRPIDDGRVARILKWTEGWAEGVALALTAADMPAREDVAPRAWAERYLTKHLLNTLDRRTVRFLEDTSVFETLDTRVLEPLASGDQVREHIGNLRRAGALVNDTGSGRYRIHPVLRELAEGRLRARSGLQSAHAGASQAYADAGLLPAAMFHANVAGDPSNAAALLRLHALAARATGDNEALRALASQINPNGADRDVRLYVDGLLEKARGSAHARDVFADAAAAAKASRDDAMYFKAQAQVLEHDLGRNLKGDAAVLADILRRSEHLDEHSKATAARLSGWTAAIEHDFERALALMRPLATVRDSDALFNCNMLSAYAYTALGAVDDAERTMDALLHALENQGRVVMQTLTLIWFARLALLWGRTTVASDAASQAVRFAQSLDLRAEEASLYTAAAEVATHLGAAKDAVESAERARSRSEYAWYATDVERVRAFAEIALARAAFLGHDNAIARELALRVANAAKTPAVQRALALAECSVYTLLCDPRSASTVIEDARNAISSARPTDAADVVALAVSDDIMAFLDAADEQPHESALVGCEPFAGLLAYRRGLVTLEHAGVAAGKARRGLGSEDAFDMAYSQLTREGPRFEARLARAYVAQFIKFNKRKANVHSDFDLTVREREILTLLVDGLANKEIAQRLVLSPRTVETHVERVLSKLEVGSRSRAIAKALRLGIVPLEQVS